MAQQIKRAGSLAGLSVLVTGGGPGIGMACATELTADGAAVTISGRRRDVLEKESRMKLKPLVFALGAVVAFDSGPALAQGSASLVLEEVLVTARKREESLQETPVAVTALTAQALRQSGVRNLYDLNEVVPNIEVQSASGNAPLANIYIRGVGQRNTGANIDSGVGIYIDDVYVGRPDGALLDLNDIQSVQVLRGPQGTLFGKNTTGGALVFTTNRPTDQFEGSVSARVGNYDRMDFSGMVNIPLTDNLFTRFAVTSTNRDGYIENAFDGKDYMDEDRINAVAQVRWVPTDKLTLDLNANYADTEQRARPQKCKTVPGVEGWQARSFNALAITPATGRTVDEFCLDAELLGDSRDVISDLGGNYKAENKGLSLTAQWDISEFLTLKSVSAWRNTEAGQGDELDHMGIPFLQRSQLGHPFAELAETDQYSQELQLVGSAFDERMQYVTGVFWFKEETDGNRPVNFIGPFDPAIRDWLFLNSSLRQLETDNEAWAVFSQVEWSLTENWLTTLGVRYTDESRELSRERFAVDPTTLDLNGGAVTPVAGPFYAVSRPGFEFNPEFGFVSTDVTEADTDNDETTFMGSVQYLIPATDVIDVGSIYLTYSEGFLSGGLSEAPTGDLEEFEPEEVDNWELGFKLDMLDRRLRVNGALFYTDYENRQLTSIVINPNTNNPAGATINAAKSSITGLELETTFLATENLELTFNATFNDGDIDEFDDVQISVADVSTAPAAGCTRSSGGFPVDACPNDRSNENLPRLPEQTYFLAAQYSLQTGFGTVIPRIQASLKLDTDYCFDSASCESGFWLEDEQFDLSARLTWISNDEKWVGVLYGTNLTDEEYIVGGTPLVESSGVGGIAPNAPRMYGAELSYSF